MIGEFSEPTLKVRKKWEIGGYMNVAFSDNKAVKLRECLFGKRCDFGGFVKGIIGNIGVDELFANDRIDGNILNLGWKVKLIVEIRGEANLILVKDVVWKLPSFGSLFRK